MMIASSPFHILLAISFECEETIKVPCPGPHLFALVSALQAAGDFLAWPGLVTLGAPGTERERETNTGHRHQHRAKKTIRPLIQEYLASHGCTCSNM